MKLRQNCCLSVLSLLLVSVCIGVFYPSSRDWPGLWLYETSPTFDKADAVFLMMGDVEDRTETAADLWKQKKTSKIILVETEKGKLEHLNLRLTDSEMSFRYLKSLGVPEAAIIFNRTTLVSSTKEEAQALFKTLEDGYPQAQKLIVCTSWYHSSRTMWVFKKLASPKYQLYSHPSPLPDHWYKKEKDFLHVFSEYLKWTYYLSSSVRS